MTNNSHLQYQIVLSWEKKNLPQNGKVNRSVMVNAALLNNKKLVAAFYDFDYRIDVDFLQGRVYIPYFLLLGVIF